MAAVFVDITMSLDGFVAGPGNAPGKGLGEGIRNFKDSLKTPEEPPAPRPDEKKQA